jgi:hypothetical protein
MESSSSSRRPPDGVVGRRPGPAEPRPRGAGPAPVPLPRSGDATLRLHPAALMHPYFEEAAGERVEVSRTTETV